MSFDDFGYAPQTNDAGSNLRVALETCLPAKPRMKSRAPKRKRQVKLDALVPALKAIGEQRVWRDVGMSLDDAIQAELELMALAQKLASRAAGQTDHRPRHEPSPPEKALALIELAVDSFFLHEPKVDVAIAAAYATIFEERGTGDVKGLRTLVVHVAHHLSRGYTLDWDERQRDLGYFSPLVTMVREATGVNVASDEHDWLSALFARYSPNARKHDGTLGLTGICARVILRYGLFDYPKVLFDEDKRPELLDKVARWVSKDGIQRRHKSSNDL